MRLREIHCALLVMLAAYLNVGDGAEAVGVAEQAQPPLVFGVLPLMNSERLVLRFDPLVQYMEERLGREVRMETAKDFASFHQRTIQDRRYDILFTAPHFFYLAKEQADYQAVARVGLPPLRAIVLVPDSSPIQGIEDLRGKRLSVVGKSSLATLLVLRHLRQSGLEPDKDLTLVEAPTHIASVVFVNKQITDAGSLMQAAFARIVKPELKNGLRVIAETATTPGPPVCVAPWIESEWALRIQKILLEMHHDEKGRAVLEHLKWPEMVSPHPGEYDVLRGILHESSIQDRHPRLQ